MNEEMVRRDVDSSRASSSRSSSFLGVRDLWREKSEIDCRAQIELPDIMR